jgi:hypothetical protein
MTNHRVTHKHGKHSKHKSPRPFTEEEDRLIMSDAKIRDLAVSINRRPYTISKRRNYLMNTGKFNSTSRRNTIKPSVSSGRFARPSFFNDNPEEMARRGR